MKTLLVIFAILVVAIFIVYTIEISNSATREEIDITSINWRLPELSEKGSIEKTFFLSDIDSCKNYYIKKMLDNNYIVACSKGSTWIYYNVNTNQKRIFIADDETVADLTAPVIKNETISSPKVKEKSSTSKRQELIEDAR